MTAPQFDIVELADRVLEHLVARHAFGEIEPSVTPAQASALYRIRDHRGREHWVNADRTLEALREIRTRAAFLPLRTLDGGKTWRLAETDAGALEGAPA
jgi:hypothetical protein